MVAAVIAFPGLVIDQKAKGPGLDAGQVMDQLDIQTNPAEKPADYDPMAIFQQEAASAPGCPCSRHHCNLARLYALFAADLASAFVKSAP